MSERRFRSASRDDDESEPEIRPWTREQAQAWREGHPQVPAWWVVAAQAAVGVATALLAWLVSGDTAVFASALYGAAATVVPAALLARGVTGRLGGMSPGAGAVGFMLWEAVKLAVSVLMLVLAPQIVQPLSWPALLVGLAVGMQVYLLALLWRRPVRP